MLFCAPESDKPEIAAFIPLPVDTKGTVARLWDAFVQKSTAGMVLILLGHPSRDQGHRCSGEDLTGIFLQTHLALCPWGAQIFFEIYPAICPGEAFLAGDLCGSVIDSPVFYDNLSGGLNDLANIWIPLRVF